MLQEKIFYFHQIQCESSQSIYLSHRICPDASSFGESKLLICLCSHAVPDGGLRASADTQAKYSSPGCILPMSVFLSKVNGTTILLPAVPSGSMPLPVSYL